MPASKRGIGFWKDESEMKSIGKYQVIEELGAGATGKTYRVRDAFRNRDFAVKILQIVPGLSSEAKEQFCGHLAACAELTHGSRISNVVPASPPLTTSIPPPRL